MTTDDTLDPAERWWRETFEGPTLELAGVFTLPVPAGWTVTGTAGEVYTLEPPTDDGVVSVELSVRERRGPLRGMGPEGFLRLLASAGEGGTEQVTVVDLSMRRASGRWDDGIAATSAAVVLTASHVVVATAGYQQGDTAARDEGERLLASLTPLG